MNWIEVNGTNLRYELSGSGKTTLVLIHEMGGTLDTWDQVLPALSNTRQVLRYDTRGAGLSEKIQGKVTFDDMADDLAALLDALGITGKVALGGTATGAAIAIHFAVRYAARASALVVTSPATGVAADRRLATLERAAIVETEGMRLLVEREGTANSYPPELRHNPDEFRKLRARWLANDPKSFAAIIRMVADSTVADDLPHIACPTLVIGCTHDRLRPPSAIEPMAKQIPGAEYLEINSGHFAGIQTPGLVSQAFHGFLFSHGY
jgi:3-oxoadipate enol-lactonase